MHERPSDFARPSELSDAPPRSAPPPRTVPPPRERPYVPPPPADAPFWLHPLALGGALAAVLIVAVLLWILPDDRPTDELTSEELAALLAEPPPPTDLPPRWDTPTRSSDLRLSTDPAGASVQLNSEWVGTTPVRLDEVPPGFYELRIVKPDFAPKDTSFYLASGSLLHLDVRLDPAHAQSAPTPSPGISTPSPGVAASSQAPSRSAGSAPARARRIQQEGQASGGGTTTPEFEVASPEAVRQASHTGSLSVTSNPPGAIVLVNGVPFGRAPLALSDLRPATYVVTLTLPGYVPISYQAEVTAQSVSVVKATFPPPSER